MRQIADGLSVALMMLLVLYACGCSHSSYSSDNTTPRQSSSSFNRMMYFLKSEGEALDDESQWLAKEEQELAALWDQYRESELKFTASLNGEQLDALGELLTTDSPAQVEAGSRISNVLSTEKSNELDALLAKKSDLIERRDEFEDRRQLHEQLVLQHESRIRAALATVDRERYREPQRSNNTPRMGGGGRGVSSAQQRRRRR